MNAPRRRWFQFSLRTLLIAVALAAIPCTYVAWRAELARRRPPSWFPLGGEVYHSQECFEAQRKLLSFQPEPRWFEGLVRAPGPWEEEAANESAESTTTNRSSAPATEDGNSRHGPPLSPPARLEDLPLVDQGASLSFRVLPGDSPDHLRFSLTLKSAERTVWREVEHRWTNTLPLLFAFYADDEAVNREAGSQAEMGGPSQSDEVVAKGDEKTWSLLVDAKGLTAVLGKRRPSELAIVAVFSERQHHVYGEKLEKLKQPKIIESQVPQTSIVVRSNVVHLKRSGDHWECVP